MEIHFCARCGQAAECRMFYISPGRHVWLCIRTDAGVSCWLTALDQAVYEEEIEWFWHRRAHEGTWDDQCRCCVLERAQLPRSVGVLQVIEKSE